jgi:hypothetical protein
MLVTRHAVSFIAAIQIDKPVQMDEKSHADTVLANLYVKEKYFVHLYCLASDPRR